jgi:hypothetical protein
MRFHQLMGLVAAFLLAAWTFLLVLAFSTVLLVFFVNPSLSYTGVLAYAAALGLPIFLILWWKRSVTVLRCMCAGILIAVVSAGFSQPALLERYGLLIVAIFSGISGAAAGVVFYFILYATGAQAPASGDIDRAEQRRGIIFGIAAFLVTAILVSVPNTAWDRLERLARDQSCHNVLRDRNSISPRASMVLDLASEEAPQMARALQGFAATYKLQFRDADHSGHRWFMTMCNDRLTIQASPSQIAIFELEPGSNWQAVTKDLIDRIEALWPGRLRFRGPQGGYERRPKELQ